MVNFKISFLIIGLVFLASCGGKQEVQYFKLNNSTVNVLESNAECLKLSQEKLGNTPKDIRQLSGSIIQEINNIIESGDDTLPYSRILFLRINNSGEVGPTARIVIRFVDNSKVVVSKVQNGNVKNIELDPPQVKKIMKMLSDAQDKKMTTNHNVIMIDFKSKDTLECQYFEDIGNEENQRLLNLSFFDSL